MPLKPGNSRDVIDENTKKLISEGYDPDQAYAIANSEARKNPHKKDQNLEGYIRGGWWDSEV